jgi:hypothetical protein
MSTPEKEHWIVDKRVFRYVCGTNDYAILYQGKPKSENEVNVHGFFNVDWDKDLDQRRLNSGYVFNMFNGGISWISK